MSTLKIDAPRTGATYLRILSDRRVPILVTAVLLVVMYSYGSYRYSFDVQVAPNLFINNSYLIVAAVGATFVILTGGIDLSIGSLVGFSTVLTGLLVTKNHVPIALAAPVVLVVGALGGFLMGCMIQYFRVQPFIATLAGLWIELDAILAVVIGGTPLTGGRFSIGGTVIGALILQTLKTTIFTIGIPAQANMVFEAAVVIIICLLQSPAFRARVVALGRRGRPSPGPHEPAEPAAPATVEVAS